MQLTNILVGIMFQVVDLTQSHMEDNCWHIIQNQNSKIIGHVSCISNVTCIISYKALEPMES